MSKWLVLLNLGRVVDWIRLIDGVRLRTNRIVVFIPTTRRDMLIPCQVKLVLEPLDSQLAFFYFFLYSVKRTTVHVSCRASPHFLAERRCPLLFVSSSALIIHLVVGSS